MKLKSGLVAILLLLIVFTLSAQKPPLDHSVYDGWKKLENISLTEKGQYVSYEVQPQEGDGVLVIESRQKKSKWNIARGYSLMFTPDERYAVCLIKPLFSKVRQAKIKKVKEDHMPKDSLAIISLADGKIVRFAEVLTFKMPNERRNVVAFSVSDTALIPKADRKRKNIGKPLVVYQLETGHADTIKYVDQYEFDQTGKSLALVVADSVHRQQAVLYGINKSRKTGLGSKQAFVSLPVFNETGNKVLYLSSSDTVSDATRRCKLYSYDLEKSKESLLLDSTALKNVPANWVLNQYSRPAFSKDEKRIFVGLAPLILPKDTSLVPFETASLDLWSMADARIQPQQLKTLKADLKRTYPACLDLSSREFRLLSQSEYDDLSVPACGNSTFALSVDYTKHIVSKQWEEQIDADLSLVTLADGVHTPIICGKFAEVKLSPDGKTVVWYDLSAGHWFVYNIARKRCLNLTSVLPVKFGDEEEDRPQMPEPYGFGGWTKDNKSIFLYDQFDIWQCSLTDGKARNITGGQGRNSQNVFRIINTDQSIPFKYPSYMSADRNVFSPGAVLTLEVYNRVSKKNGYATLQLTTDKASSAQIKVLDGFTFSQLSKAAHANVYAYQKANFSTSPDVYLTTSEWKTEEKLSDINPQMKNYLWGNVELVKWKAYDGTELEGLLYKPENFDPGKKYPLISYFYEKYSDKLYAYFPPAPSRSTINISFYCSRGYVVFVPDIVYKVGQPGESAYNCIVSGVENVAKNSWIDRSRMAIQGQSWGGYQVAYLVTRTSMFRAAGAGAPVSNMTSAYGGIRWESGVSRQFQYEHSQSRIGKSLWEAPELYLTNSPLFRADKVETPLLIMSNDADGAVPYYQGIEYFLALRRLGKQAWMLQYNDEAHNLTERKNMKDLSRRLQQFFDYYLKGEPMPAWMKTGIPAIRKGQYFGFENAE